MPTEVIISVSVITAIGVLLGGLWRLMRGQSKASEALFIRVLDTQHEDRKELVDVISHNAQSNAKLGAAIAGLSRDVNQLVMTSRYIPQPDRRQGPTIVA